MALDDVSRSSSGCYSRLLTASVTGMKNMFSALAQKLSKPIEPSIPRIADDVSISTIVSG